MARPFITGFVSIGLTEPVLSIYICFLHPCHPSSSALPMNNTGSSDPQSEKAAKEHIASFYLTFIPLGVTCSRILFYYQETDLVIDSPLGHHPARLRSLPTHQTPIQRHSLCFQQDLKHYNPRLTLFNTRCTFSHLFGS